MTYTRSAPLYKAIYAVADSPQLSVSSSGEDFLVAVLANTYPVILIARKDYIAKSPIVAKVQVRIVRTRLGAYDLSSPGLIEVEYDTESEYPIRP
jgi:hypothetical protein